MVVLSAERVELLISGLRGTEPGQQPVLHQVSEPSWVIWCITSPSTFHHHHQLASLFSASLLARLRLSAVVCAEGYRGGAGVAGGAGGRQMNQLAGGQINTVVV